MEGQSVNVSNFAGGDHVGGSWTDKIMGMKSATPEEEEEEDQDWVGIISCVRDLALDKW